MAEAELSEKRDVVLAELPRLMEFNKVGNVRREMVEPRRPAWMF